MLARLRFERMVYESQALPFWYGPTYQDVTMGAWVCHPIPLNFLVRWSRALWFWLSRAPGPDALEEAYNTGYEKGFSVGEKRGEIVGYSRQASEVRRLYAAVTDILDREPGGWEIRDGKAREVETGFVDELPPDVAEREASHAP